MILETLAMNQSQLAEKLGVSRGIISEFVNGSRQPSKEFIFGISRLGISIDWFITGKGHIFFYESNPSTKIIVQEAQISGKEIFINKPNNIGNGEQQIRVYQASAGTLTDSEDDQNLKVFRIPLLTKEQVLHFDPDKEIPDPKAHSGYYPDYTLAPMPGRFRDYSTDLRAIVVFDSLMMPLLSPGEVAIFQATGWNGDGVYVYRVSSELHISHVRFDGEKYVLTKEFKPEEQILYHAESFGIIGRVRAVVREIG
jgi:transcriptional regulator with XRE-family HTH domain